MLTENELKDKKAANKTWKHSLLIWVGWALYLVLISLMGTLIGLILAEYWEKEECCACGCAACQTIDFADHVNASLHPDFCNELDFSCTTCSTGTENPLNSANKMLRPLLLSLTTALIPFLVKKISLLEQRNDIGEQMKVRVLVATSLECLTQQHLPLHESLQTLN